MTIGCDIYDFFGIKLFFLRSEINVETFCMDATFFGKSRFNNFLLKATTDRSKIISDHHR